MKAITLDRYGSPNVLRLREIDKPSVNEDDVLVRIRAASVNPCDCYIMTGTPYVMRLATGLLKPKTKGLGADLADHVIDYTREDFTRSDRRYDLMLDNVGNHSLLQCRRVLAPHARYLPMAGRTADGWGRPPICSRHSSSHRS